MFELSKLKETCETTGQCTEYELRLQQEQQKIDHNVVSANQTAIAWGLVFCMIGLFILLTPLSKSIKRLQKIILPSLVVIMPIIIGLGLGVYIGFVISFSACFKQPCSPAESAAIFIVPLLSLVLTGPLAIMIYKKRSKLVKVIDQAQRSAWITIGVVIILLTAISTYTAVSSNIRSGEARKIDVMSRNEAHDSTNFAMRTVRSSVVLVDT